MTALWARGKTGRGQFVQASLLAGRIATMTHFAMQASGVSPMPMGHAIVTTAPY